MENSGLISFEDHTINHRALTGLSFATTMLELSNSKKMLEAETGRTVNFIAYPDGASNLRVQTEAWETGFVSGFGTWGGKMFGPGMNLPRVRVYGSESLAVFASRL